MSTWSKLAGTSRSPMSSAGPAGSMRRQVVGIVRPVTLEHHAVVELHALLVWATELELPLAQGARALHREVQAVASNRSARRRAS